MNERRKLCRDLARCMTADTTTITGASQAAIYQTCRALGVPFSDEFLDSFKQRHTEVLLTLTTEIEDLYAGIFEESDLTLEELH